MADRSPVAYLLAGLGIGGVLLLGLLAFPEAYIRLLKTLAWDCGAGIRPVEGVQVWCTSRAPLLGGLAALGLFSAGVVTGACLPRVGD